MSERSVSHSVFVSYASSDQKQALGLCDAIERRGTACWISARDVAPGENYQEAIVRALRASRAMVVLFSGSANNSDEIKKELSLASRYRLPVIAFRIDDVEPSDAFAYELSTRQWIDASEGWDNAVGTLSKRLKEISTAGGGVQPTADRSVRRPVSITRRGSMAAASILLLLIAAVGAWLWSRPTPQAHSLTVRMAGFKLLSSDLPSTMPDAVDAEVAAAFNADGVVGVSTGAAPASKSAPGFALGGTLQRDGQTIRVITRLTNERSGEALWSATFNYDGNEVGKVPRHVAVDAGNVVRCGLFGASTYRKQLPDNVLRDYLQFCQGHWTPYLDDGSKALVPAQRVVAALPDFSWGWAAVAGGYWKVAGTADNKQLADQARAKGREAADRAIAIDGRNSEALYIKAMLLDRKDWIGRDGLLKRAVAAKRLDCGCEYHQYGWMLVNVGRVAEGVAHLRQANDMLALYLYTPLSLADALVAAGKPNEAKPHYDAAIDLAPDADFANDIRKSSAGKIGDIDMLLDSKLPMSAAERSALVKGYRAVKSQDSGAKAEAVKGLLALPPEQQREAVAMLLADLGATHEAFLIASRLAAKSFTGPSIFWSPRMRETLNDPGFGSLVSQLGLVTYWKATGMGPDVCKTGSTPPFCRLI